MEKSEAELQVFTISLPSELFRTLYPLLSSSSSGKRGLYRGQTAYLQGHLRRDSGPIVGPVATSSSHVWHNLAGFPSGADNDGQSDLRHPDGSCQTANRDRALAQHRKSQGKAIET